MLLFAKVNFSVRLAIMRRRSRNAIRARKSATESAGGLATKGLTGKREASGKWIYESDPLRPSVAG